MGLRLCPQATAKARRKKMERQGSLQRTFFNKRSSVWPCWPVTHLLPEFPDLLPCQVGVPPFLQGPYLLFSSWCFWGVKGHSQLEFVGVCSGRCFTQSLLLNRHTSGLIIYSIPSSLPQGSTLGQVGTQGSSLNARSRTFAGTTSTRHSTPEAVMRSWDMSLELIGPS